MYENDPRPIVEFARILLFDAPKRVEMLKNFIAKNPDFAPAHYELSREFSEDRKGSQTLTDKRSELKALQEFSTLKDQGKFIKYFVDQEIASDWILDSEKRLKALSLISEMKDESPLSISASTSNSGWHVRVEILEFIREIFYKLPSMNEFKSLGHLQYINPSTGLRMANQELELACPPSVKKYSLRCDLVNTEIDFKYIDMTKIERGPFTVIFDGKKELDIYCRRLLELNYSQLYEHLCNFDKAEN
jgi:hypothetical protein